MGINSEDLMKVTKICSNKNYGDVEIVVRYTQDDLYDFYIKSCSSATIDDLKIEGFNLEMCQKGLRVYKFYH